VDFLVTYRQITLFNTNLKDPFNEWTKAHIQQGFSWRPSSVSFDTLEDGKFEVKYKCLDPTTKIYSETIENPDAIRIIRVPFNVYEKVEIASITESKIIEIDHKEYDLLYLLFKNTILFLFLPFTNDAEIIKMRDKEPPECELIMTAIPG
jgi:hypothetical protein